MSKDLFNDFKEVSAKQWKQKIQYDLKGADYNEKLVWNSPEGIKVKPFYHPDEISEFIQVDLPENWEITEHIYVSSGERANKKALRAIENGAESLWFQLPSKEVDMEQLLEGIDPAITTIYIKPEFSSSSFFRKLQDFFQPGSKVYLQFDIIGNLARSGNWFTNQEQDFRLLKKVMENGKNLGSNLSVDASLYQNAGATATQQLAYALAHTNEYFHLLSESSNLSQGQSIQFVLSVGPNYFFEIAKIRALRILFNTLRREYGFNFKCNILVKPSRRNKTLYDYNVNLLRTTTECMSAVLGGADSICNMSYDAIYHKSNEFGTRMARNQLLILKHESYFEKAANPAQGSYYIESLTKDLADKALDIFKTIEKSGGFLHQLKEGIIQRKIEESAIDQQEEFAKENLILIGTNKFKNPHDKMKEDLELYPFVKHNPRKTILKPIIEKRLSETIEQERIELE